AHPGGKTSHARLLIVCGTVCMLAGLGSNVFLAYQAQAHNWNIPADVGWVKWFALYAGVGMAAVGALLGLLTAVVGRALKGADSPRYSLMVWAICRWFLGVVAGLIVGAIAGMAVGSALAVNRADTARIAGGVIVGAFVGAALGGRRAWLVMLGCTIAGYFVGS